jgi:hypothetical protein
MVALLPHPASPKGSIDAVEATVRRGAAGGVALSFRFIGRIDDILIPSRQPSTRTDELWKHTCCEAFVMAGDGYYEFNLSPSSQWAAYRFDRYRQGMRDADVSSPAIRWREERREAELTVELHLPDDATGALALSAVVEARDGSKSYWALAHPPGQPDFHAAACFVGELPPAH